MVERLSGIKDIMEKMDILAKKKPPLNLKCSWWKTSRKSGKRPNLRVIRREGEDSELKDPESFPTKKKEMPIKVQEANITLNIWYQKRKFLLHIIIKTVNI